VTDGQTGRNTHISLTSSRTDYCYCSHMNGEDSIVTTREVKK